MKTSKALSGFVILFILSVSINSLSANWVKNDDRNSSNQRDQYTEVTESSLNTQQSNSDSLPAGVTREWMNDLRDEKGNRIMNGNETSRTQEDPESDAMQRKVFNGLTSGSNFGYSVKSAGDVNGDGYDDIIVGAYGYTTNTGRAFIYYGGLSMNTVADVVMTGQATSNFFGWSVSGAGDINADGYDDVIVGADGFSSNKGRAYVYFGGAVMNNTADMIMTGKTTGTRFATSVSSAGDINGDGFPDLILGELSFNASRGRVYIYYGGIIPDTIADKTITGEAASNFFGVSVSSVEDFNGDGYSDFMVGANGYLTNTGRSYIYFGGANPDTLADVIMTGEAVSNFFGNSVSSAGDVNGDGYSDVISGAYVNSSSRGKAYIYFGGAIPDNTADVTMTGEAVSDNFGISVSSAGDINGDGYSDVIAGAYFFSSGTGKAYIYFGGVMTNNVPDVTLTGEATNSFFGISVSSAGDVNGDGYADVIIGARGYSSNTGRVYLYDYFMKNEIVPDVTMTGEAPINRFGVSVSSAGDVNGDGYADVIVGAEGYSSNTGRAYIFFGGGSPDNIADVTMTGEAMNNFFGTSVSSAGDVNGDGYADVIVGAKGYSSNTGRAYIFLGGLAMNNTADVTMTGVATNNYFGTSVSSAGDVNGDGYADVIVGANGSTGRAYIFFAGELLDNIADVKMTGTTTFENFGTSVSSAGDVNGDGYADVIVSAYNYSSGTGRADIFFGGVSPDTIADVKMTGEATNNFFGTSVSSAGDMNGDGYADVIVGAENYSSGTGRAYIFFGGLAMNNIADVIMTGEATDNYFGVSVSTAGDMNGDGYADVIVGAYGYSSYTGRAYIYFGSLAMNNIADVIMTGEATDNYFGYSVSTAGDVNGDGYSDFVASSYNNSTGRSYMYYGSAISAKPIINFVKDVPNDQGGKVNLKWARSGLDVAGINKVTEYIIYRSYPPSGGGFSWEQRAVINATNRSFYTYTDNTPSDSSSGGNGTVYYQIMARTANAGEYYLSGILYGRSIDNIAPLMVSPFSAAGISNNVNLTWEKSTAPDLLNYILYRSVNPTIDPNTEPVFATTADSTYLDTAPLSGMYYYFIVAQDIHNNKSPVAVAASPEISFTLNLTMFIQGFYNPGIDIQVSDTVTVELRNAASPYAVVDQAKKKVGSDGTVQLTFPNAANGNYYFAVKHRNSIETWSAAPLAFSVSTPVNYNLSSSSAQAFGSNLRQIDTSPLRFGIYSGDQNQDGFVNLTDVVNVFNSANAFVNGYVASDMTGDNLTDLSDLVITSNNASAFVAKVTP